MKYSIGIIVNLGINDAYAISPPQPINVYGVHKLPRKLKKKLKKKYYVSNFNFFPGTLYSWPPFNYGSTVFGGIPAQAVPSLNTPTNERRDGKTRT